MWQKWVEKMVKVAHRHQKWGRNGKNWLEVATMSFRGKGVKNGLKW